MGIDPNALCNHKLNTTNISTLAADLSVILDAAVTYGYQQSEEPFDDVVLGIAGAGKSKLVRLREYDYLHTDRDPEDEHGAQYECSGFDDGTGCEVWMNIYKDCFEASCYFIGRWGWYVRTFTGENDSWEHMLEYRRKIWEETKLFGGDTALIYADSGSAYVLKGDPHNIPFAHIVENMISHPGFLNVSAWMRDESAPFVDDPMVFLDDFSFWPSTEQMMERARRAGKLD